MAMATGTPPAIIARNEPSSAGVMPRPDMRRDHTLSSISVSGRSSAL